MYIKVLGCGQMDHSTPGSDLDILYLDITLCCAQIQNKIEGIETQDSILPD